MDPLNLTTGQQADKDEIYRKTETKSEKAEISRVKWCQYTAEYRRVHKEWVNQYQKDRYNMNDEYRKKKSWQVAYIGYLKGINVANHIVDQLKEAGYRAMPYRKTNWLVIFVCFKFVLVCV